MWFIDRNIIKCRILDGELTPTASEISAHVFDGVREIAGKSVSLLSEDLPGIDFYRYLARIQLRATPASQYQEDGLDLEVLAELDDILRAFSVGVLMEKVGHVCVDGVWLPLDLEEVGLISARLKDLGISSRSVTVSQLLDIRRDPVLSGYLVDEAVEFLKPENFQPRDSGTAVIGLKADLYPYQKAGVAWMSAMVGQDVGFILGDEMGLGKTIQMIALFLVDQEIHPGQPNLVVVPSSLVENWKREIRKFAPHMSVLVHHGPYRSPIEKTFVDSDVVVTTYDLVKNDLYLLKNIPWNLVVLDEAQAIRNPDAERTMAVKRLRRRASVLVTGTPLVNRLTDVWSLADFLIPGYLGSREEFETEYPYGVDSAIRLESKISPILLRRRVSEVSVQLPPKIMIPQWLEMSGPEKDAYDDLLGNTLASKPSFEALVRLRMFCSHPDLVGACGISFGSTAKMTRLFEIVEEIVQQKEKFIIFAEFVGIIERLESVLREKFQLWTDKIYGGTKVTERQEIIDRFSGTEGAACLILNYMSGGVGLNIQAASHVILFHPVWNPADEDQAVARAYRTGQKNPVRIHRLSYISSVEELMEQRLETKRHVIDHAVEGVDGTGLELTKIWAQLSEGRKD